MSTIVLVGDLSGGYQPYGPFESISAARAWAEECKGNTYIMHLRQPVLPEKPKSSAPIEDFFCYLENELCNTPELRFGDMEITEMHFIEPRAIELELEHGITLGINLSLLNAEAVRCPKCKKDKAWSADTWRNDPENPKGVRYVCSECARAAPVVEPTEEREMPNPTGNSEE